MNNIKKIIYKKKLSKSIEDELFIKKVNNYYNKINIIKNNENDNLYYNRKIKEHYKVLRNKYLYKNDNTISFMQKKKIAFNYHLYLLQKYYDYLYENSFI